MKKLKIDDYDVEYDDDGDVPKTLWKYIFICKVGNKFTDQQ